MTSLSGGWQKVKTMKRATDIAVVNLCVTCVQITDLLTSCSHVIEGHTTHMYSLSAQFSAPTCTPCISLQDDHIQVTVPCRNWRLSCHTFWTQAFVVFGCDLWLPLPVVFVMLLCAKHYATKAGKKKARLCVGSIFAIWTHCLNVPLHLWMQVRRLLIHCRIQSAIC